MKCFNASFWSRVLQYYRYLYWVIYCIISVIVLMTLHQGELFTVHADSCVYD